MKAAILLALRSSLGLLLVVWGFVKITASEMATTVSDSFYGGLLSLNALIPVMGVAQVILGLLVILGLFRTITYTLQAAILVIGAVAILPYILDPFGMYFVTAEQSQILFFPSLIVAFASLGIIAFKSEDCFALDELRQRTANQVQAA